MILYKWMLDNGCLHYLWTGSGVVLLPWVESWQLLFSAKRCTHLQQTLWFNQGNYFIFVSSPVHYLVKYFTIFTLRLFHFEITNGQHILCRVLWINYDLITFCCVCEYFCLWHWICSRCSQSIGNAVLQKWFHQTCTTWDCGRLLVTGFIMLYVSYELHYYIITIVGISEIVIILLIGSQDKVW